MSVSSRTLKKICQLRSWLIEILNVHRGYASGFDSPGASLGSLFERSKGGYLLLGCICGSPKAGDLWALFFFHPGAESFEAFLGGLFNEGHVLGEMLLCVDFAFFSPFQLGQPEL